VPAATARGRPLPAGMRLDFERPELVQQMTTSGSPAWTSVPSISPYRCRMRFCLVSKSGSLLCFQVVTTWRTRTPGGAGAAGPRGRCRRPPLGDQNPASLLKLHAANGRAVVLGAAQGDLLDLAPLAEGEGGRPAAGIARVQRVEPVQIKVVQHVADPVLAGECHLGRWPARPCHEPTAGPSAPAAR
jgi:hypothetical protein